MISVMITFPTTKLIIIMPIVCSIIFHFSLRYLFFNAVSHSPYGLDKITFAGRSAHLFSQVTDVDHNRIVAVFIIFFFPDFFKQPLRTDDLPTVVTQQQTQSVLKSDAFHCKYTHAWYGSETYFQNQSHLPVPFRLYCTW